MESCGTTPPVVVRKYLVRVSDHVAVRDQHTRLAGESTPTCTADRPSTDKDPRSRQASAANPGPAHRSRSLAAQIRRAAHRHTASRRPRPQTLSVSPPVNSHAAPPTPARHDHRIAAPKAARRSNQPASRRRTRRCNPAPAEPQSPPDHRPTRTATTHQLQSALSARAATTSNFRQTQPHRPHSR